MSADSIYVLRGAPNTGDYANGEMCLRRLKSGLSEVTSYGERGSENDQLRCPVSVTVDASSVWIADRLNNRVMQRSNVGLGYENKVAYSNPYAVHTRDGSVVWVSGITKISELAKADLSTVREITNSTVGVRGRLLSCMDITSDNEYLYALDSLTNRVVWYDLETLQYSGEFGISPLWGKSNRGICFGGGYLYVSDYNKNQIHKVNPADFSIVATFGHVCGGAETGYIQGPQDLFYYGGRIFATDTARGVIKVLNSSLEEVAHITHEDLYNPTGVVADGTYIYAFYYGDCFRFDYATFEYVDTVAFAEDASVYGAWIDSNYIYLTDQETEQIMRLNRSTLAYVDGYDYSGNAAFVNPASLSSDGTNLYVSDNTVINRVALSTMTFVDTLTPASTTQPKQCYSDGTDIYVADGAGGVQKYLISTMELLSESPDTAGDSDYWLMKPIGLTLDSDFIYVSNSTSGDQYETGGELRIYNRETKAFVDSFAIPTGSGQIAVDDTHLYVPSADYSEATVGGIVTQFLKADPYASIATVSDRFAESVDTYILIEDDGGDDDEEPEEPPPTTEELNEGLLGENLKIINPYVILQWSDDGGFSWSNEHWLPVGRVGEFRRRLKWNRLGRSKNRAFRITVSDPCKWVFTEAILDAEVSDRRHR